MAWAKVSVEELAKVLGAIARKSLSFSTVSEARDGNDGYPVSASDGRAEDDDIEFEGGDGTHPSHCAPQAEAESRPWPAKDAAVAGQAGDPSPF